MKIFYKILPVVISLSAIITLNLTAYLKKPSYDELLVVNLKPQPSDYEYLKQLDDATRGDRFEKTYDLFKKSYERLKQNSKLDNVWAEEALTWSNILARRAKFA